MSPPQPLGNHRHWLAGLCVAVLGMVLALWLAWQQAQTVAEAGQARFRQEARAFADALAQRIEGHTEVVNGLRGLFIANPQLTRAEFERAASQLDVVQRYPGVRNLAFTRWVPGSDRAAYEARVRADTSITLHGYPDFAIRPPGERAEYYVAEYLWPMAGNEAVLGLDISAQPTNLAAMQYVRDSGRTVASAPFDLLQESTHRAGIVIRVPVFDYTTTTAQPRFLGAVASTIRVYDMVQALASQGLLGGMALTMDDLGSARPGATDNTVRPLLAQTSAALPGAEPFIRDLQVHDRRWRLSFVPEHSFLSAAESRLPVVAGVGGVLVSLLLGSTVGLLVRRRTQALAQAAASDHARRESEERFRALFNQASVGVTLVDVATGRLLRANQRYADIVGRSVDELLTLNFQNITHADDVAPDLEQLERLKAGEIPEYRIEKRYFHSAGHVVWADLTVSPMWLPGAPPDRCIAVVQDITARKLMEESLRHNEQRLRAILQRLPVGVCLLHRDGRLSFRNDAFVQMCGYTEQDVNEAETWWTAAYPDPAYRERARTQWIEALRQARRGTGNIPAMEYDIRCKDGTQRTVEFAGVVMGRDDFLLTMVDLTQRKAAEEEINQLAYYDPLTRLPNRRLLRDRLQQALASSARHHSSGALLLIDLDNFKTLNETLGHDSGDNLLLQVAHRLRSCVHEDDTVARQGGDEFVVVLEELGANPEEAAARSEEVGQRILAALREPYALHGTTHHSSISMGVTVFSDLRETVDELLKRADLALYQAKNAGRDTLRFYDPQMQAAVSARAALERDMRIGLAEGQFELYYQPQIDRGRITGAEALLRWRHPHSGFISPAQFIPLAEETGLILPLGEWVLQTACQRLAIWATEPHLAGLSLAVNVSPRQFHQANFVAQVLAALAGCGAEGQRLKLEMTESLLLQDVQDTIDKMGQLKAYGVGFSLDDFGTGYSSLAYLKRLPLAQLKIDQSFVRDVLTDPNDAAIARTVVALGTSLGLRVIAEGVETEAQREFLERHQCHAWQGYLFSPPVPVAQFEELVRGQTTMGDA